MVCSYGLGCSGGCGLFVRVYLAYCRGSGRIGSVGGL